MSDNKKYYYLKLKDNFYDSDEIKILEEMENGYKYTTLLLKLYLRSLKNEGALRLNEFIPYDNKMIAAVTNMDIDTVRVAMDIFKKLKLIEVLEDGTIYLLNIQNYIGESSTEADRIRDYRKAIELKKHIEIPQNAESVQMYDKCTPEIELKTELEKEIKIKIDIPYLEIIEYLNLKSSSNYRHTTSKNKDLIKARWNERFTLDDFKIVIDKKCNEWLGTEHAKYLRPETLFGTKFEGYLNQKIDKPQHTQPQKQYKSASSNEGKRTYTDIDKLLGLK